MGLFLNKFVQSSYINVRSLTLDLDVALPRRLLDAAFLGQVGHGAEHLHLGRHLLYRGDQGADESVAHAE
jgi:hypothetical protein